VCGRGSLARPGGPCRAGLGGRGEFSTEHDPAHAGPSCSPDKWTRRLSEVLDSSPLAHDYLELLPGAARVLAGQRNHLGPVFPHSRDLRAVVLDPAVPGDYEPALPCYVGNPYAVRGSRSEMRHAGRARRWIVAPGSPGYVASLRSPAIPSPNRARPHRSRNEPRPDGPWASRRQASRLVRKGPTYVGEVDTKRLRCLNGIFPGVDVLP
jgi:hypothetical protein